MDSKFKQLPSKSLELRASRSMNLDIHDRAQISGIVVDEIVSKYKSGSTVDIKELFNSMQGFMSRTISEIAQAIDFGEAQGRLVVRKVDRTIYIV